MLLKKLLNFFLGYCVIMVEGPRKERFINFAINEGIDLWDIIQEGDVQLWARVAVTDIGTLRHIARQSRCPFKIVAKAGLPFVLKRAEKRKGLVTGGVIFLITLYWLASHVWFIDVHSAEPLKHLSEEKILGEAYSLGLKPGASKSRLHLAKIERNLAISLPHLTFVSIEIQGTLARIEVVEKKIVDEKDKAKPAHIIATKDGMVEEILVLLGEPKVKEGDKNTNLLPFSF
jgi:similar to stage IV sporulation protein